MVQYTHMSTTRKKTDASLAKAFEELEKIVAEFETGDIDLEKGIPRFKQGLELAAGLKKRLRELENEIEEIRSRSIE